MVFKKHLSFYHDEELFDLEPTSEIARQLGAVISGEMLTAPKKSRSALLRLLGGEC